MIRKRETPGADEALQEGVLQPERKGGCVRKASGGVDEDDQDDGEGADEVVYGNSLLGHRPKSVGSNSLTWKDFRCQGV